MPVYNHYLKDNRITTVEIDEGLAVKITDDDKLRLCTDGEDADGISLNHVTAGFPCTFIVLGHPLVTLGADVDITVNPRLTPAADGSGKLVPAAAASGKKVVVLAKQSGANGDQVRAQILPRAQFAA